MKRYFTLALLLICALSVVIGCGKGYVKTEGVTGTITLDGQPLENCNVYFIPLDKSSGALDSFAKTDAEGHYKLQTLTGAANAGTTPGKYGVQFDALTAIDTGKTEMVNGVEMPVMKSQSILPNKYKDSKTSGFEVEVVSGANTFDFALESK